MACARRPVTATQVHGDLQRFELHLEHCPGKCHGYKDLPTESEQTITSTVAKQTVPIGIERHQSSFQSDMSGVIYAVRAYAPAESFKKDLKMLRVRQEFESVNSLGPRVQQLGCKEGGLTSIRDDESEGECQHVVPVLISVTIDDWTCVRCGSRPI